MDKESKIWLNGKMNDYNNNPTETLESLLNNTTTIMNQYLKNPTSEAAKSVLKSCVEHNQLFLDAIEK